MSERPGTIAAIYDIDLARPRSLRDHGPPGIRRSYAKDPRHFYAQGSLDA
jgi:NitT/TauT family transport system ATP-binding protein